MNPDHTNIAHADALLNTKRSTRLILFETDVPGYEVATHGGSMFVVIYQGRPYGVTAKHNIHDFQWKQLIVTDTQFGKSVAGLRAVYFTKETFGAAKDTDISDVAVIEFSSDIKSDFFENSSYNLSNSPISDSQYDDKIIVYGAITECSWIEANHIQARYAELNFDDIGPHETDPTLRSAKAQWKNIGFNSISGVSGGPVFNLTRNGVCGMTVRGKLRADGTASAYYVEIRDIIQLLGSIANATGASYYTKSVVRRE